MTAYKDSRRAAALRARLVSVDALGESDDLEVKFEDLVDDPETVASIRKYSASRREIANFEKLFAQYQTKKAARSAAKKIRAELAALEE